MGSNWRAAVTVMASLLALAGAAGCTPQQGANTPGERSRPRDGVSVPTGPLALGEDSGGDETQCQSGVQIHAKPKFNEGYYCSVDCAAPTDCPSTWQCRQIYPSVDGLYCVPPSTWVSQATTPVGTAQ
jgi:hypothetical protein